MQPSHRYTIPQDFGRVVLNLINNAFYAVNEKGKNLWKALTYLKWILKEMQPSQQINYAPLVLIKTKELEIMQIKVIDNGGMNTGCNLGKNIPALSLLPQADRTHGTGLGLSSGL